MFKNLKLSLKIGFGFAVVVLISTILGLVAVINMTNVKNSADKMEKQYVPQVEVANNVERFSLTTMYEMRGYGLTANQTYLESGNKYIQEVKDSIQSAKDLYGKYPELTELKEGIEKAETKLSQYEQLISDTIKTNEGIESDRSTLDAAAADFMKLSYEYLNGQRQKLKDEINSGVDKEKLLERFWKITTASGQIVDAGNSIRIANFKFQALDKPEFVQEALKKFDDINSNLDAIKAKTMQDVDLKSLEGIRTSVNSYKTAMNSLYERWTHLQELNGKRAETAVAVLDSVRVVSEKGTLNIASNANESASALSVSSIILIVGLIVAIILGILMGFIIIMSITKPINKVAAGLNEGSEQVYAASEQLSSASQQLAEANSEQAASIQETSSTLEESSSMIQQNNENTKQAAILAAQAKTAADRGNTDMKEMMVSMDEIKKSSDQIAKIIKVIDEIAFQTNILALNAAVEAARAGDAGMGFAVVAEEVRNLAQRSAQAAKDTASIIENNIDMSQKGVDMARRVGESLSEITLQAKKVNELMDEIAAASQEQSQGISQINKAIQQMEKATQENAATAEESASASEELSAQAENLKEIVDELFKLVNGSGSTDHTSSLQHSRQAKTAKISPSRIAGSMKSGGGSYTLHSAASGKHKVISPDEVIPLEMDKDDF